VPNFTVVPLKMWAYNPKKWQKWVISGIYLLQRGISIKKFLQNLAWGSESQVLTIMLTFTIVALKMWVYGP